MDQGFKAIGAGMDIKKVAPFIPGLTGPMLDLLEETQKVQKSAQKNAERDALLSGAGAVAGQRQAATVNPGAPGGGAFDPQRSLSNPEILALLQNRGIPTEEAAASPVFRQAASESFQGAPSRTQQDDLEVWRTPSNRIVNSPDGGRTDTEGRPIPNGSIKVGTVQPTATLGELTGVTEKEAEEAGEQARAAAFSIAQTQNLLRKMEKVGPAAFGIKGFVAQRAGLVTQIDQFFGTNLEQPLLEGLLQANPGTSLAQVRSVQQDLQRAAIRAIPLDTGERTGRISEPERRLAEVTEGIGLATSFGEAQTLIRNTLLLNFAEIRRANAIKGTPLLFDTVTNDGKLRAVQEMRKIGIPDEAIPFGLVMLEDLDGLLEQTGVRLKFKDQPGAR